MVGYWYLKPYSKILLNENIWSAQPRPGLNPALLQPLGIISIPYQRVYSLKMYYEWRFENLKISTQRLSSRNFIDIKSLVDSFVLSV